MIPTILVLDDDEQIVSFVSQMLQARGYDVIQATTERDGLTIVESNARVDLAIIDFWLGERPSLALLDAIEERRPSMPVVVMSGGGSGISLEISHSVSRLRGANQFLQKPFRKTDLQGLVQDLLP